MDNQTNASHLYKFMDLICYKVSKMKYNKLENLLNDLIFSDTFSDDLKARAIFSWMSFVNIHTLNLEEDQNCATVLNKLKGGISYAEGFHSLISYLGMKSVCIKGWAKGENYMAYDNLFEKLPNHTWNAVLLNGNWFLVDCFWSRKLSDECTLEDFDDFFFCTEPNKMIYNHFPECSEWQLLVKPLSFEHFINLPYVRPDFFKFRLSLNENYLLQDLNSSLAQLKLNHHSCEVNFSYRIISFDKKNKDICLNHYIFQAITDKDVTYFFRPPFIGTYYLQVFAYPYFSGYEDDSIIHNAVIDFKIKCNKVDDHPMPFPSCSDACWGIPQKYKYLVSPLIRSAYMVNHNGKFAFTFNKFDNERIFVRLINDKHSNDQLMKCVNVFDYDEKMEVLIKLNDDLEYGLEVYLKENSSDDKFRFCFQLLLCAKDYLNHINEDRKTKTHDNVPSEIQEIFNSVCQLKWNTEDCNDVICSQMFKSMCLDAGFQCEIIQGYVKGKGYKVGAHFKDDDPLHSWNAIHFYNSWHLVDCHWACERIYEHQHQSSIVCSLDDFYFLPSPQDFIFSHYPINQKWQLLDPTITQTCFEKSVILKSAYFKNNIKLMSDYEGVIYTKKELLFKFRLPDEKEILLSSSIKSNSIKSLKDVCLDNLIMQFQMGNIVNFVARFSSKSEYQIVFYVKKQDEDVFEEICEYVVHYDGDQIMSPFPPLLQPLWGASHFSKEINLHCSYREPILETNDQGIVNIIISNIANLNFNFVVTTCNGKEVEKISNKGVLSRRKNDELLITMMCTEKKEYCLAIYACNEFDGLKEYHLAFQFLIICRQANTKTNFPNLNCSFLGPQNMNSLLKVDLLERDDYFIESADNFLELKFKVSSNKFVCKLLEYVGWRLINRKKCFLIQSAGEVLSVNLVLPSTNIFVLQLFGSPSSSTFINIYNVLLMSHNVNRKPSDFPKQLCLWNGFIHEPLSYDLNNFDNHVFKLEVKNVHKTIMKVDNTIIDFSEIEPGLWYLKTTFSEYKSAKVYILVAFKEDIFSYHNILQYRVFS